MADHEELVTEMLALEQMGTQERQKLAKKRRMQQLKKWGQREKEWLAKEKQLNRRLANILNEENNGLNLKQFTSYNSNQRTKVRLASTSATNTNTNATATTNYGNKRSNGVEKNTAEINKTESEKLILGNTINNNNLNSIDGPYSNTLMPNGRVHFNVGVMLLEAAARNDYDEVKRLLTLGVSPDSVNHDGLTALHQCCIDASETIMNLLLEFGANVDARDTERWTPLHAACTCGHLNLVKTLVEHDADLLAVNGDANMPFDICEDEATLDYIESQMIKRGITQEMIDTTRASLEIQMLNDLERLVASGKGDLNRADENGITQLHIAAANNYLSVVRFLLRHGVNVNVCDNDLWRPLHGVACWGNEQHIKVAELLVEDGADLNANTTNDETVFDLCDNPDLLERLNQLKDELESKQTNEGTDRLRRTQSRTNSRVHSVRRTRVQDKNQISRREAREEAMLRVESSETINANGGEQLEQKSLFLNNQSESNKQQHSETDQLDGPSIQDSGKLDSLKVSLQMPLETNLDQAQPIITNCGGSPTNKLGPSIEATLTTRSQQERHNSNQSLHSQEMKSSQPNGTSHITTMKVSGLISTSKASPEIMSSPELSKRGNVEMESMSRTFSSPQATSIVQVNFTPMNYTLANLKKHRSEVRMRTAVIGGGGNSSTSLISSTVHQDMEPGSILSSINDGNNLTNDMTAQQTNGWSHSLSSGAATSFNKFHGAPSEIVEERQHNYKCCAII